MYLQFQSLTYIIAALLCLLAFVYTLTIVKRPTYVIHLLIGLFFLAILYLGFVYASIETDSIGARHRLITIPAVFLALIHFHQTFIHFPHRVKGPIPKINYGIQIAIAISVFSWFAFSSLDAKPFFRPENFWDYILPLPSKIVAFVLVIQSLVIAITGFYRLRKANRENRQILIGILGFFLLSGFAPAIGLSLYRAGVIGADLFLTGFSLLVFAGFIIFHVFITSYNIFQSSLSAKVLTILLAMFLASIQVITPYSYRSSERQYDEQRIALLPLLHATESLPQDMVYLSIKGDSTKVRTEIRPSADLPSTFVPIRSAGLRTYKRNSDDDVVLAYTYSTADQQVEAAFSLSSYRAFIHDQVVGWISFLILSLLVMLTGFAYFFRSALLQPLQSLVTGVSRVESGDLGVQLANPAGDELGLLTRAFNNMVRSLREARQELQQYTANLEKKILERDAVFLDSNPQERKLSSKNLIFASRSMEVLVERVEKIAHREQPVLITGETGTGKEIIAHLLHEIGRGSSSSFVPINCAAIPATLWESQIFGHVRGAFTDAKSDFAGSISEAEKGTLFFDEVGEMPLEIQPKILRLLQEGKYKQVGGKNELKADCRLIFATHRNLKDMVAKGLFREDLYYRINVFEIRIPSLRERASEIPLLVNHFIESHGKSMSVDVRLLEEDAMNRLSEYPWPGNVRELENTIVRTLANVTGDRITLGDLPEEIVSPANGVIIREASTTGMESADFESLVALYSKRLIETALRQCKGNKSEAARLLRISRGKLQYQMKNLGMDDD